MSVSEFISKNSVKTTAKALMISGLIVSSTAVFADGQSDVTNIGTIARNITNTFTNIASMMMGMSYVAGIGFFIGAIFKFKQHKDNPTQIPMGTPIALLMIAVCLVFMPYIISTSGATIAGEGASSGIGSANGTSLPGVDRE